MTKEQNSHGQADLTVGLDPVETKAMELLLAADLMAHGAPLPSPALGGRWRDPIAVALLMFGLAVILLVFTVRDNNRDRTTDIANLTGQIGQLQRTIETLNTTVDNNNDRITVLQQENAYLVRLLVRLCNAEPNNPHCRIAVLPKGDTGLGATRFSQSPTPQPSPQPSQSGSLQSRSPSPQRSPKPSRSPSPSPTSSSPGPSPTPSPTSLVCVTVVRHICV